MIRAFVGAISFGSLLAFACVGCGSKGAPDVATARSSSERVADPQVPASDSAALAADNAAFAFAAYQQFLATHDNLVFSPVSISIALAMVYAGAAGTTASEMASALHFTLPSERLHPAFNALDQALTLRGAGKLGADGAPMRLHVINAVWAERTYTFRSDYLDTLALNYGAGVNLVDFIGAFEPTRQTINAWVAAKTEEKIQNLLPQGSVDGSTRLALTDAVYFNAAWNSPFDPTKTCDGSFTLLDNSTVSAKFMNQAFLSAQAIQGPNYLAVSLPYQDDRLALLLVIPDAGQFSQVESSLDEAALADVVGSLTSQPVSLSMPRFKVETDASLATLLATLGMTSAFNSDVADFSGMDGTQHLHISDIFHDAFIDVAEKGTEAAAATAVVVPEDQADITLTSSLTVRADHPFIFVLQDQPTGAILFMGRVLDPNRT
jgi:serpin B